MTNLGRFWLLLLLINIDCSIVDHCQILEKIFDDSSITIDQAMDSNQVNCKDYGYQNCCVKDDMKKKAFSYVLNNFDAAQTRQLNAVLQDLYQKIRKLKALTQKQLQINEARLLNMFEDQFPSVSKSSAVSSAVRSFFRHLQSIFRDQHQLDPINSDSQLLIKLRSRSLKLSDFLEKISTKFFRSIFPPIYVCLIADDCGGRRRTYEKSKNLRENYTECLDEWADGRKNGDDEVFSWYGEENLHNLGENLLEFLRPVKWTIEKMADFRKNLINFKEQDDKNCKIDVNRAVFCSLICQNSTTKIKNRICISNAIKSEFEKNCSPMNFAGDPAVIGSQTEPEILDDMPDIRPIFRNIFQNSVVKNGPAISAAIFDYCGPLLVDDKFHTTNSSSSEENHPIRKKSIRRRAETLRSGSIDVSEKTIFQVVSTVSQDLDSMRRNWFIKLVNDSVKSLKSLTNVEYTTCSREADTSTKNVSARYVAASTEMPISTITVNRIEEQELRHTQGVEATSPTAIVSATLSASTHSQHSNIAQNSQNYIIEYNGGVEGSGSGELLNNSKHRKSIITDDDDYVDQQQQQNDDNDFSSGDRPLGENAIEREEYSSGDGQLPMIGGQKSPQDAIIEELLESSSSNNNLDEENSVTSTFESVLDVTPGIYAIQTVYQSSGQRSDLRISILLIFLSNVILYRWLI